MSLPRPAELNTTRACINAAVKEYACILYPLSECGQGPRVAFITAAYEHDGVLWCIRLAKTFATGECIPRIEIITDVVSNDLGVAKV